MPVIAPLPEQVVGPQPAPRPVLLAHILVSKYCDHLPLYHGRNRFTPNAIKFPCSVKRWRVGWRWPPTGSNRFMNRSVPGGMAGGYVQLDETPVLIIWSRAMAKPNKGIFGRAAAPVAMCFSIGKPAAPPRCLENVIPATFTGTIQRDGLRGVSRLCQSPGPDH